MTREGITVIGTNNLRVYNALEHYVLSGQMKLQLGEFLAGPPIRSGTIPHPDWSSPFVHAEIQAEFKLRLEFKLTGPGTAWSHPSGCGFCVPALRERGILHQNQRVGR